MRNKLHCTVEKIRAADGAQCIRFGPGLLDVVWLTGITRAKDVTAGDTGTLVYNTTASSGLWHFVKDGP